MAIDVAGAESFETLGIRTQLVENEATVQQLRQLGAEGEASAAKIASAHKAAGSEIEQSYTASFSRTRQVVEQQLSALTQVTQGLGSANKQATELAGGLARGLREQATAGRLTTEQMEQLAAAEAALAGNAKAATVAVEEEAVANTAGAQAANLHGLQFGRLNQELGTGLGRVLGMNTALTRLGAQVGGAVIGYGSMIAVLGAVTVAASLLEYGYNKLTESARKAREEQERLQKGLEETSKKFRETATSDIESQIESGRTTLRGLEAQLADRRAQLQAAQPTLARNVAIGALTPEQAASTQASLEQNVAAAQQQVDAQTRLIKDALGARARIIGDQTAQQDQALAQNLASLIKSDQATAAEVQDATKQIARARAELATIQKTDPTNYDAQAKQVAIIQTLTDALKPARVAFEGVAVASNAVLDGLVKQGDELRKVAHEDNAQALAAQQAAAAVGLQGEALAIYNAHAKAEREILDANARYSGVVLTQKLDDIKADEARTVATAKAAQAVKDSTDQLKANAEAMKDVTAIGQHNIEITRVSTTEFERLGVALEKDVFGGFSKFIQQGHLSFQSLAQEGTSVALQMLSSFDQAAVRIRANLAEAIKAGHDEQARADEAELARIAQMTAEVSKLAAAFAGVQTGQQFGQQAGSLPAGVVGGAVSGAAQGYQIAGPAGALIGGITGAIGGLVGASEAQKEAAQALKDAAKQIEQGLASFGASNSVAQALNSNQSQYLQLETAIIDAMKAGIKTSVQAGRNPGDAFATAAEQLAKLEQERAANAQRISDNFWLDIQQQLNALNGPAGAFQNALIQVDEKFRDNIESARALGATDEQLRQIEQLRDKQEQALRDAEKERLAQVQLSLDARQAEALGLTDQAAAIQRKAEEDKQLFDAQQQHYTDAQIAQLKYIQGLEDEARAKKKLTDANQTLAENLAAGPSGTLTDVQNARLQPLLQKQADDAKQYAAALAKLTDDIAAGADAATIAADKNDIYTDSVINAGDAAAITAQKFRDAAEAMNAARSDIQRDVQLGFLTGDQAVAKEKQAFGFGGLTNEEIRALYTPYSGTPLTAEQETTNANIATFFQDLSQFMGTGGVAGAATRTASSSGKEAIVYAAQALTEVTGNRMADYLDTISVYVREIVGLLQSRVSAAAVASSALGTAQPNTQSVASASLLGQPLNLSASASRTSLATPLWTPQPVLPPGSGADLTAALSQWFGGNQPRTQPAAPGTTAPSIVISVPSISVTVQIMNPVPDAMALAREIGDTSAREIAKKLAPYTNTELARLVQGQRFRDGDPTKLG